MSSNDTTMGGPARELPSTMWTQLAKASDPTLPEHRECLNLLVQRYWKPVYAYIRMRWRKSVEDAKDLTQGFFAHMLDKNYFARVRPERGTFRAYLLTALKHFLVDAKRAGEARRPESGLFSLEAADEELRELGDPRSGDSPDLVFEREWFHQVLEGATTELRSELAQKGKESHFEIFRICCLDDAKPPTYEELGGRFGLSHGEVRHSLERTRVRLREIVRARVREYVLRDEDVDPELQEILG